MAGIDPARGVCEEVTTASSDYMTGTSRGVAKNVSLSIKRTLELVTGNISRNSSYKTGSKIFRGDAKPQYIVVYGSPVSIYREPTFYGRMPKGDLSLIDKGFSDLHPDMCEE